MSSHVSTHPQEKKKKKKKKKKRKKSRTDDDVNNDNDNNRKNAIIQKKRSYNNNIGNNNNNRKKKHKAKHNNNQSKYHKQQHQSNRFSSASSTSLSSLQSKFLKKLSGAKFRTLNEELYTKPSEFSFNKFQSDPKLFFDYHDGFREQVKSWPKNPLDMIIGEIKKMKSKKLIIGDFGCGEAVLATSVPNKVYSFDLVAQNKSVIACNIANVPLKNNELDIAVFCLALMGTDYYKFILESHRVLKLGGTLLIAEVESRFCHKDNESARSDILQNGCNAFISMVEKLGFKIIKQYPKTSYFVLFKFEKIKELKSKEMDMRKLKPFPLKACIYKRR